MVLFEAEVLMYGQAEGVGLIGAAIILWSGGQPEPCQNEALRQRTELSLFAFTLRHANKAAGNMEP